MMKISLILFVLPILISGCRKNSSLKNTSFIGTWEIRKIYGGGPVINYTAGNDTTITFTDNSYEMRDSGILVKSGVYTILKDNSASMNTCMGYDPGEFENRIIYDNDTTRKEYFQVTGNTLTMVSGCFAIDAGAFYDYEKIK